MKRNCAALTCFNNLAENPSLSFFSFPKDFEIAKRWAIAASREDLTIHFSVGRSNYLCSDHFESKYFEPGSTRFKTGVVPMPSIFQGCLSNELLKSTELSSRIEEHNYSRSSSDEEICDIENMCTVTKQSKTNVYAKRNVQIDCKIISSQTVNNEVHDNFGKYNYSADVLDEVVSPSVSSKGLCTHQPRDFCRLCSFEFPTTVLTTIFENKNEKTYLEMIEICLSGKIHKNDGLPQYICNLCALKLEECYSSLMSFHNGYNKLCEMKSATNGHSRKQCDLMSNIRNYNTVSTQTESSCYMSAPNYTAVQHSSEITKNTLKPIDNPINEFKPELSPVRTELHQTLSSLTTQTTREVIESTLLANNTSTINKTEDNVAKDRLTKQSPIEEYIKDAQQTSNEQMNSDGLLARLITNSSKKANILKSNYVKTTLPLQNVSADIKSKHVKTSEIETSLEEATKGNPQINYECSVCFKLLKTQDDLIAHCLSQHPLSLQGTIVCNVIKVKEEQLDEQQEESCGQLENIVEILDYEIPNNALSVNEFSLNKHEIYSAELGVNDNSAMVVPVQETNLLPTTGNTPNVPSVIVLPSHGSDLFPTDICNSQNTMLMATFSHVGESCTENVLQNTSPENSFATDTCTENVLRTCLENRLKDIISKDSIENLQNVAPTKPLQINSLQTQAKDDLVINYECPICYRFFKTKKKLIQHCLKIHSLPKQDKIVCKVLRVRKEHEYSKKPIDRPCIGSKRVRDASNLDLTEAKMQVDNLESPTETSNIIEKENISDGSDKYEKELEKSPLDSNENDISRLLVRNVRANETVSSIAPLQESQIVNNIEISAIKDVSVMESLSTTTNTVKDKSTIQICDSETYRPDEVNLRYECSKCSKWLSSKKKLIDHCIVDHNMSRKEQILCKVLKTLVRDDSITQSSTRSLSNQSNKVYKKVKVLDQSTFQDQRQRLKYYGFKYECMRCKLMFMKKETVDKHNLYCQAKVMTGGFNNKVRRLQHNDGFLTSNNYRNQVKKNVWFKCEQCGESFHRLLKLFEHRRICEKTFEDDRLLFDSPRDKEMPTVSALQLHMSIRSRAVHESRVCVHCGRLVSSYTRLKIHERLHTDERPYKCDECPKLFRSAAARWKHKGSHNKELNCICHLCGKGYRSKESLSNHMKTHVPASERRHICEVCGARYLERCHLNKHKARHCLLMGPSSYKCTICGKMLKTSANLETHIQKKHINRLRFKCPECGKGFPSKYKCTVHHHLHTGVKPYACPTCSKCFRTPDGMRQHKLVHSDNAQYMCDLCGKGFKRKDHLRAHEQKHSAEKPYSCQICQKTFSHRCSMYKHRRIHGHSDAKPMVSEGAEELTDETFAATNMLMLNEK